MIAIGGLVLLFDGQELSWLAGLVAGAAAATWFAVSRGPGTSGSRPSVPVPSQRRPDAAARRTAATIGALEHSGWRFLHDVPGLETTYDHIAIGPGGVILMQSMDPDGVVAMQSGEPVLECRSGTDAPPRLERLRPRALADAAAFRDGVQRLSGRRLWVQAMVVFWSEFPAGCVADGRCVFIHGPRLAEWMARRPHQLDPRDADAVYAAVKSLAPPGGEHPLQLAV